MQLFCILKKCRNEIVTVIRCLLGAGGITRSSLQEFKLKKEAKVLRKMRPLVGLWFMRKERNNRLFNGKKKKKNLRGRKKNRVN